MKHSTKLGDWDLEYDSYEGKMTPKIEAQDGDIWLYIDRDDDVAIEIACCVDGGTHTKYIPVAVVEQLLAWKRGKCTA